MMYVMFKLQRAPPHLLFTNYSRYTTRHRDFDHLRWRRKVTIYYSVLSMVKYCSLPERAWN